MFFTFPATHGHNTIFHAFFGKKYVLSPFLAFYWPWCKKYIFDENSPFSCIHWEVMNKSCSSMLTVWIQSAFRLCCSMISPVRSARKTAQAALGSWTAQNCQNRDVHVETANCVQFSWIFSEVEIPCVFFVLRAQMSREHVRWTSLISEVLFQI